jgi:hypothetical protein
MVPPDGRLSLHLDPESQTRRKSHGPQHPQVILAEPHFRVPNRSHHLRIQVRASADEIQHLAAFRIHHQTVDGEVPPQDILPRVALKLHAGRPPPIGIIVVAAKGRHFHVYAVLRSAIPHQHHSEVCPHLARAGKQFQNSLRRGIGRNIEVFRRHPEQKVAHAAAHQICLVPCPPQPRGHLRRQHFRSRAHRMPYANISEPNAIPACGAQQSPGP